MRQFIGMYSMHWVKQWVYALIGSTQQWCKQGQRTQKYISFRCEIPGEASRGVQSCETPFFSIILAVITSKRLEISKKCLRQSWRSCPNEQHCWTLHPQKTTPSGLKVIPKISKNKWFLSHPIPRGGDFLGMQCSAMLFISTRSTTLPQTFSENYHPFWSCSLGEKLNFPIV